MTFSRKGVRANRRIDPDNKIPKMNTGVRRGAARYKATHGPTDQREAAREAFRRRSAEINDNRITGWTDDGEPIRDEST